MHGAPIWRFHPLLEHYTRHEFAQLGPFRFRDHWYLETTGKAQAVCCYAVYNAAYASSAPMKAGIGDDWVSFICPLGDGDRK